MIGSDLQSSEKDYKGGWGLQIMTVDDGEEGEGVWP